MHKMVRRMFRYLPYRDMLMIAEEVSEDLGFPKDKAKDISDALCQLGTNPETDADIQRSHEVLAEFFTRRRTIQVKPVSNGWEVTMTGGHIVVGDTVIDAVTEFITTLPAYRALVDD